MRSYWKVGHELTMFLQCLCQFWRIMRYFLGLNILYIDWYDWNPYSDLLAKENITHSEIARKVYFTKYWKSHWESAVKEQYDGHEHLKDCGAELCSHSVRRLRERTSYPKLLQQDTEWQAEPFCDHALLLRYCDALAALPTSPRALLQFFNTAARVVFKN